jgi:hypothetical protein
VLLLNQKQSKNLKEYLFAPRKPRGGNGLYRCTKGKSWKMVKMTDA